jgi:hypothetical protein
MRQNSWASPSGTSFHHSRGRCGLLAKDRRGAAWAIAVAFPICVWVRQRLRVRHRMLDIVPRSVSDNRCGSGCRSYRRIVHPTHYRSDYHISDICVPLTGSCGRLAILTVSSEAPSVNCVVASSVAVNQVLSLPILSEHSHSKSRCLNAGFGRSPGLRARTNSIASSRDQLLRAM